jgi:hypothetical protein
VSHAVRCAPADNACIAARETILSIDQTLSPGCESVRDTCEALLSAVNLLR